MVDTKVSKNYEFYVGADLGEYAGKWVALVDGKIVAVGDRADLVGKEAENKHPGKEIALVKVPKGDTLIL